MHQLGLRREGSRKHTKHEIGKIDKKITLGGVMIRQDTIVDKVEPESIGDDDDNALGWVATRRTSDVGVEVVELDDLTLGLSLVDGPLETVGTGHCGDVME